LESSQLRAEATGSVSGPPLRTAKYPEPLCRFRALPEYRSESSSLSEGVTLPSSLVPAHASDQNPPSASRCARAQGLCRLLSAPAGSWPFPTLVLQSVLRCLDPYPVASIRCIYPLLPGQLRPHLTRDRFGTRTFNPCTTTSHRGSVYEAAVIR
jgi:hypothetical protein